MSDPQFKPEDFGGTSLAIGCLACGHDHPKSAPSMDSAYPGYSVVAAGGACPVQIPWHPRLTEGGDFPPAHQPKWMSCMCPERIDVEVAGCERHGPPPREHQRYLPCLDCAQERVEIDAKFAAAKPEIDEEGLRHALVVASIYAKHGITPAMIDEQFGDDWDDE